MTDTATPAYPATSTTVTRDPAWPAPFLQTIKDRDRARDAAVALEQEVARALEILGEAHRPVGLRVHDVEMLLRGRE